MILGSTRPGRRGEPVAKWVMEHAKVRPDASLELIDLLAARSHTVCLGTAALVPTTSGLVPTQSREARTRPHQVNPIGYGTMRLVDER